jgi:hypothetical protein
VLDAFGRANSLNLGTNWQQASLFGVSGITVNGNQALSIAGSNAFWKGAAAPVMTFGTRQAAEFSFANATLNTVSLYLKASGTSNTSPGSAIRVRYSTASGGQVLVDTTPNGTSYTNAATLPATFSSGDTITAMADETGKVLVWRTSGITSTLVGTAFTTFTGTGRIGIFLPTGARIDNFAGGSL